MAPSLELWGILRYNKKMNEHVEIAQWKQVCENASPNAIVRRQMAEASIRWSMQLSRWFFESSDSEVHVLWLKRQQTPVVQKLWAHIQQIVIDKIREDTRLDIAKALIQKGLSLEVPTKKIHPLTSEIVEALCHAEQQLNSKLPTLAMHTVMHWCQPGQIKLEAIEELSLHGQHDAAAYIIHRPNWTDEELGGILASALKRGSESLASVLIARMHSIPSTQQELILSSNCGALALCGRKDVVIPSDWFANKLELWPLEMCATLVKRPEVVLSQEVVIQLLKRMQYESTRFATRILSAFAENPTMEKKWPVEEILKWVERQSKEGAGSMLCQRALSLPGLQLSQQQRERLGWNPFQMKDEDWSALIAKWEVNDLMQAHATSGCTQKRKVL
jgi:hypothetical protein